MLIQRCAWHAFFRGYPRPLRVLSWRGRGVSFSDSICPSCADRVRVEGLWGSPPPPVWPGSPQTALIFVGLPLLCALVLLATPLHDPGPPPPRQEAAVTARSDSSALEPRVVERETAPARISRPVVPRERADAAVPAVIYETRRIVHRSRDDTRPAAASGTERIRVEPARADARTTASSLGTQSP